MLCSPAFAYHKFSEPYFKNSEDVFEFVTNGNHQVYILFIYNPQWAAEEIHHPMKARYDLERSELQKIIGQYGRNIHYSEINVASGDFTQLLQEVGINTADLDKYPVTVAIDDGHGVWVQGPREYHRIKQVIDQFEANPESHWY
ncbi:unnamed protein product [Moneuplotes crassus]|uniref:Uncharacterized protein n=2 Tax=Euplotes crassus TaxID=5936 RepID=A0AAD2D852_EUPCR|nr:unnamed protein product [Moneuplotes crassus]